MSGIFCKIAYTQNDIIVNTLILDSTSESRALSFDWPDIMPELDMTSYFKLGSLW